jgi:hypothetical protein
VPEIVEAYVRQCGTFEERLEVLVSDVPGIEGLARLGCENEPGILVIRRSKLFL